MSAINDGGPAFPVPEVVLHSGVVYPSNARGMTLRDWFAGQALAGSMATANGLGSVSKSRRTELMEMTAEIIYEMADAMLAARKASK